MVADGLSIVNADFSSTSFRPPQRRSGRTASSGNRIVYPRRPDRRQLPAGDQGHGPVDGPVREGVGLLGSPSFEIPRTVDRDSGVRPPSPGREPPPAAGRPRTSTTWSRSRSALLVAGGCYVLGLTLTYSGPSTSTPRPGVGSLALATWWSCSPSCCSCWWSVPSRAAGTSSRRVLHLRPVLLASRALLEVPLHVYLPAFNGRPSRASSGGCWGSRVGQASLRRRLLDDGEGVRHHRRRVHAQRGQRPAVPLPGGRRLQVRPHHARRRLHRRGRRPSSTTASRWATGPSSASTPSS